MYTPVKIFSREVASCMLSRPHRTHWWAYTSEGGGHMVQPGDTDSRNYRLWLCPGNEEH